MNISGVCLLPFGFVGFPLIQPTRTIQSGTECYFTWNEIEFKQNNFLEMC